MTLLLHRAPTAWTLAIFYALLAPLGSFLLPAGAYGARCADFIGRFVEMLGDMERS